MNIFLRLKAAVSAFAGKPLFPGGGMGYSLYGPRTLVDWRSEVGNPMDSSIVAPYIAWIVGSYAQGQEVVVRSVKDQKQNEYDHKLVKLLQNPNPYYSGRMLEEGFLQDLKLDGTAFIYVVGDSYGLPKELYWLPTESMRPEYRIGSDNWIDAWAYAGNGVQTKIDPSSVIVAREGIDRSTGGRRGYSRFKAGIAEAFSDNEARNTVNTILRSRAQMGMAITPDGSYFTELLRQGIRPFEAGYTEEQAKDIEKRIEAKNTKDNRGALNVFSTPMAIREFGSVLDKLDSRVLRSIPEERLGALFGVHPASVHLGSGLITSSDKHNIKFADRMSWQSVMALQNSIAELVNTRLLPFMDSNPEACTFRFDNSKVEALQEDQNEKSARVLAEWRDGVLPLGTVQQMLGYEVEDRLASLRYPDISAQSGQRELLKSLLGQAAGSGKLSNFYMEEDGNPA